MNVDSDFALQVLNCLSLGFIHKTDDAAGRPSSGGSSAAVHVALAVVWRVKVKNAFDVVYVYAAGGDISRDKN